MELPKSIGSKLGGLTDLFRPTWRCHDCGKTYRSNQRSCSQCDCTVFDRVR